MKNEQIRALGVVTPRFSRGWALALTTCLLVVSQGGRPSGSVAAHQGAGAIVEDPRAVAKAMALISRQLGWNITYEDPVYVHADDLLDITKTPIEGWRLIVPRWGRVRLPDDAVMAAPQEDPVALLESVLGTEETLRGRVKRFKVLRSGSMFHVVPDKVLDAAGLWQAAVPILGTSVSISHGEVNLSEFLQILCAEVGAVYAVTIKVGKIPTMLAVQTTLPAQERTAEARTLLTEALSTARQPLSWLLMYDPSNATYHLHIVPPEAF